MVKLIQFACPRCQVRRTVVVRGGQRTPTRVICPRCAERAETTAALEAGMVRERDVGDQLQIGDVP